jgi:glycosyltransferase involved in cell wall biosynthesis
MKIAVYHNQPPGGARRALTELIGQLARRHAIDVYTLETADEAFLRSDSHAPLVRTFPFRRRSPIRGGFYVNELRELLDLRDLDAIGRTAAAVIDSGNYDVALVDVCRFMQAPSVLNYLDTPNLYYCHEPPRRFLEHHCRPAASPQSPYQRLRSIVHTPARAAYDRVAQRLDRRNVLRADAMVTNSLYNRTVIREYYQRDADVSRLGVDTTIFRPAESSQRTGGYVLSVGAIESHKAHDFLIRSLARCPKSLRPRLVIAGNTSGAGVERVLSELAGQSGVELDIRTSVRDGEELVRLYQQAQAFVFSAHHEPFGLVLLEAMACAIPVVSVDEGGPREIIEDGATGHLVPRDEVAFADAVSRVLEDRSLAGSLGRAARQAAVTRWTWEAAGERLDEHLQRATTAVREGAA